MKTCLLAMAILINAISGFSQENAKFEIFTGYSFNRMNERTFDGWNGAATYHLNSWLGITLDASGFYKTTSQDIDIINYYPDWRATYKNSQHNLLIGPTFTPWRNDRIRPFVHFLAGVNYESQKLSYPGIAWTFLNDDQLGTVLSFAPCSPYGYCIPDYEELNRKHAKFAMALGGGLDIRVNKNLSVRPIQADFMFSRGDNIESWWPYRSVFNESSKALRFSTGLVFTFGGK